MVQLPRGPTLEATPRGAKPAEAKGPWDHHLLEETEGEMVDPLHPHQGATAMEMGLKVLEVTLLEEGMELMVQEPEEVTRLLTTPTGTGNPSRRNYMKSRN